MKKLFMFASALMVAALFAGCETGDGDREYGYAYVMMPQAQRIEGYYAVPGGSEEYTRNFRVENGKVQVFLGVLRSGKVADKAFSVDIVVNDTPAEDFVYDNIVPGSMLMQEEVYTLPERADVSEGSDQTTFYLELDVDELTKPAYDGKKLVLCVELADPTRYKLSRDSFRTVIVVDVDAIRTFIE
jgi:hypothetical protein